MSAVKKGTTAIWTMESTTLSVLKDTAGVVITPAGTVYLFQNISGGRRANKGILYDGSGDVKGAAYGGKTKEIQIDVIPTGATLAAARLGNIRPVPGSQVTFTDADDPELTATPWICEDSDYKRSNSIDAPLMITMKLWNSADSDISAPAAA
jgi:hypothetical protein